MTAPRRFDDILTEVAELKRQVRELRARPRGGGLRTLTVQQAIVNTNQSRTTSVYGDLATVGPQLTVTPGPSGIVMVWWGCLIAVPNTQNAFGNMSLEASGGNVFTPTDNVAYAMRADGEGGAVAPFTSASRSHVFFDWEPVPTTITAKYNSVSTSITVNFQRRHLMVMTDSE